MDTIVLKVFQRQVWLQCKFMLTAADQVNLGLRRQDIDAAFCGIQNLLTAAANISKALWGRDGKYSAERKPLRESVGIGDDSPLRMATIQNHYEHFDEQLDTWFKESKNRNVVDSYFGSRSSLASYDVIDCFRAFDPVTTDLTFWGEEFNVQDLMNECLRIIPRLRDATGEAC